MAKALLSLTPKPTGDESWDWRKRYWDIGERVCFSGSQAPLRLTGKKGVVQSYRVNRYGRVSYEVMVDGTLQTHVLMEELIPPAATNGNTPPPVPTRSRRKKRA